MIYAQKLTLFLAIAYSMMACRVTAPENWNDAMALMVKYNEKGRHDDAIEVAQDWMKKHPADASHGFVFYDQIAVTYLIKAFKDSAHKDQWIRQAVDYYEKDLAAHEKGRVDVELYTVGRGYEYAGDLSTYDSCLYYGRAIQDFEDEVRFIQGDSYTAYGHTAPLAPVRRNNERALERVKSKFDKAGCSKKSPQSSVPN